jgi:hypothetical protein
MQRGRAGHAVGAALLPSWGEDVGAMCRLSKLFHGRKRADQASWTFAAGDAEQYQ